MDYYVRKKSKFLTSFPVNTQPCILVHTLSAHACIHKMIHFQKRKIKYTTIFYLYLKEVRLIKNNGLGHSNTCYNVSHSYQKLDLEASWFVYQRELLNLILCSFEKFLYSSTIVAIIPQLI